MTDDESAAYAALRAELDWPRGRDLTRGQLVSGLSRLANVATTLGSASLVELVTVVLAEPDAPDALYDLGYALIDAGAPAIAATVLWRCLAIVGDSEDVVTELVSALESALAYPDAFAILEQHAELRERSFMVRYLYAFNAAMSGRLDITRAVLPFLVPDTAGAESMRETIAGIVERADRVAGVCSLDARDLRGWHYVLTGGLLTHRSPYGFDSPMHGRYAWLADSVDRVVTGVDRLNALVAGRGLPCVYTPSGYSNGVLAAHVAARLRLDIAPWPAVGVPAPGLVVIYDLAELTSAEVAQLVNRRPDQIVYAHASPWTVDSPVAPDITTLLYQQLVPPWDESDPLTALEHLVSSNGLRADEEPGGEAAGLAALVARVWPLEPGPRSRLWAGGPVASRRFT